MVYEYHFESGPIHGHVLLIQMHEDPTPSEIGRRVSEKLNRHFYALKDTREASWGYVSDLLCITIEDPPVTMNDDDAYELVGNTFIWTHRR